MISGPNSDPQQGAPPPVGPWTQPKTINGSSLESFLSVWWCDNLHFVLHLNASWLVDFVFEEFLKVKVTWLHLETESFKRPVLRTTSDPLLYSSVPETRTDKSQTWRLFCSHVTKHEKETNETEIGDCFPQGLLSGLATTGFPEPTLSIPPDRTAESQKKTNRTADDLLSNTSKTIRRQIFVVTGDTNKMLIYRNTED